MRQLFVVLSILFVGVVGASVAAPPLFNEQFEWPGTNPTVIPDLRIANVVAEGRKDARDGATEGLVADRNAGMARRVTAVRKTIGRGPKPMMIAGGTVMNAVPLDGETGPMIGTITYPTGDEMIGNFGDNRGVFTASPESWVADFHGWVQFAASGKPSPQEGVFNFKNGESFTGSYLAGSNASGVYSSTDGEKRFVGVIDMSQVPVRPVHGVLEDRRGKLLAVVGP